MPGPHVYGKVKAENHRINRVEDLHATGNTPHQGAQATTLMTGTTNNGLWFPNYQDANHRRTSTTIQTPAANNMSPASTASVVDIMTHLTHILTHIVDNKNNNNNNNNNNNK